MFPQQWPRRARFQFIMPCTEERTRSTFIGFGSCIRNPLPCCCPSPSSQVVLESLFSPVFALITSDVHLSSLSDENADETNLTTFQLRSGNTATYPMYVSTAMLQRERVRSANSLEVLAFLPRYKEKRHPTRTKDENTFNRRLLVWEAVRRALHLLLDDSPDGPAVLPEVEHSAGGDDELDYAFLGTWDVFGDQQPPREVYALPLLYIAGMLSPCAWCDVLA